MVGFKASLLIAVVTMVVSHLSCDRDFPETLKTGAYIVFIIFCIIYVIFGIF